MTNNVALWLEPDLPASASHPCLTCGACCAFFRVTFYWSEADDALGGTVPVALTRRLSQHSRCMLGTELRQPRCTALAGTVGQAVRCTIYENRPSPCREFAVSGEDGQSNPQCDKARAAWGLPPETVTIVQTPGASTMPRIGES